MKSVWTTFCLCAAILLGLAADANRQPQHQFTARCYQAGIREYHAYIHPFTSHIIRCRYQPTCSNYSSIAVARFGIARGLRLTVVRLLSCRPSVPPGTLDPLPTQ